MDSYFTCMCELDNADTLTGTLHYTKLVEAMWFPADEHEATEWEDVQDLLYVTAMYAEAHDKVLAMSGEETSTIRFFCAPKAETDEFETGAVALTVGGHCYVLTSDLDLMQGFAQRGRDIVMW